MIDTIINGSYAINLNRTNLEPAAFNFFTDAYKLTLALSGRTFYMIKLSLDNADYIDNSFLHSQAVQVFVVTQQISVITLTDIPDVVKDVIIEFAKILF